MSAQPDVLNRLYDIIIDNAKGWPLPSPKETLATVTVELVTDAIREIEGARRQVKSAIQQGYKP